MIAYLPQTRNTTRETTRKIYTPCNHKKNHFSVAFVHFTTEWYLNQHMEMHKENPFKCDLCEKFYTRQVHLKAHISEIHIKDKPFKCNICEAEFSRKYTLFKHEKTHTSERPFKCNICGNTLGRRDSIQRHIILTHNNGGPLAYTICDVVFTRKKSLHQHMLSHKERKFFLAELVFLEST